MIEEKVKKEYKPINPEVVKKTIDEIVSLMTAQDSAGEVIKEKLKELKTEYGLKSTAVRAACKAIMQDNQDDLTSKVEEIINLIDLYNK